MKGVENVPVENRIKMLRLAENRPWKLRTLFPEFMAAVLPRHIGSLSCERAIWRKKSGMGEHTSSNPTPDKPELGIYTNIKSLTSMTVQKPLTRMGLLRDISISRFIARLCQSTQ